MATVADDALNGQAVNRMLGAGADVAQAFQQGILRMTNDYNQLGISAARTFETTTQLMTYNGAMELSGNAMQLQAGILNARSVQAHPEFRPEFVDGLMKTRGKGLVPDEVMAAAAARLETPLNDKAMAAQIAAFLKNPQNAELSGA